MRRTKRSYAEIRKDVMSATTEQELRKLHKELKEYGSGILFFDRYPKAYVPIVVTFRIAGMAVGAFIGTVIGLLLLGIM